LELLHEPKSASASATVAVLRAMGAGVSSKCAAGASSMRSLSSSAVSGDCLLPVRLKLVGWVDRALDRLQDVDESIKWADAFEGAFHPVGPAKDVPLVVKSGALPQDIAGAYMRVGPNPTFWPPKKRTHAFDGDGMVHSIRFAGGSATYHCAYMETPRWKFEQEYGSEWFTRIGEFHGIPGLLKILTVVNKKGKLAGLKDHNASTANTAIGYTPEGKLWALNEGGAPFRFRLDENGCPKSIGFDSLEETLQESISAHPKVDQRTGEIFFHGRRLGKGMFYVGRIVDGKLVDRTELSMPDGFHHDMFITEKYVVVVDGAMRFGPEAIAKKKPLWMFAPEQKLRFGIFPRAAKKMTPDAFTWIEAPEAAEIVHTLYAYDEGDKIILWTPLGRHKEDVEDQILGGIGSMTMHKIVIDMTDNSAKIHDVPGGSLETEFPRIRDDRIGQRVRYGFSGLQGPGADFNFNGILKWDFEENKLVGKLRFPEGVIGGEPVFIPGSPSSWSLWSSGDDRGYVGMFLWRSETKESTFALFDAETLSPEPVVEMLVPTRVPLGFHAFWINEEQFQKQLALP